MTHVRIFNHYINGHYLLLGMMEYLVLVLSFYFGTHLRFWYEWSADESLLLGSAMLTKANLFAVVMMLCMIAMGVYPSRFKEGLSGMALRTMVSFFLLGFVALSSFFYMVPDSPLSAGRGVLVLSALIAFALTMMLRITYFRTIGASLLSRKVLVVGAGHQASKLVKELADEHNKGFNLEAFVRLEGAETVIPADKVIDMPVSLKNYVHDQHIEEIVVAADERRRSDLAGVGFPLDQLLDCKLSGIPVMDVIAFLEREAGKIEPRSISPGWFVYSDGFYHSGLRDFLQRGFDLFFSSLLIAVAWPFMLLTFIAIKLEDGLKAPIFYSQERVGLNGKVFKVHKFRSMRTDAEKFGAVWAQENDPRVTKVGKFIRNVRIDELPQIFNVFSGDMSFVGPRPERPQFVEKLKQNIPFFDERHRVKPGITGWAQLCYPYGASDEDSEQKLKYDLYYVKNRSLLLDLVIIIQTVEVVLIGKGVR